MGLCVEGPRNASPLMEKPHTAVYATLQLLYFVLNSWCNLGWHSWPVLERLQPAWLFKHAVAYIRALAPLRIVAAYGVFPPGAMPPQKWGA